MNFIEFENAGKRVLEQYPVLKRSAKRIYQLTSYMLSKEKLKVDGNILKISPDDKFEYFYGYYDKSPWDSSDRYIVALKAKQTYKSVAPEEPAIVGLIDTDNNKFHKIGITHAWNVQQGCMAQWMGPDFETHIIYNDFRRGHYCSIIYNVKTKREEKELPCPVYDVSQDGCFALSLDFSRLHRLRPGYGYSNLPDSTKNELCPNKVCIWKLDIKTGKISELLKYTDIATFELKASMINAEHKVNHLMISPNGKRFMFLHRWFQKGRKYTRLITANIDTTEMYNLSDDGFVSHCYWKNDLEILSFLRKNKLGDHYYLMKDKTQEYRLCWPKLITDGHCSYSPDKSLVITDTYPSRKRLSFIYVCKETQEQPLQIAKIFSPFKYDNNCRCDLHPRWNRAGNKVCIDSVHDGKRGLYVLPIDEKNIPLSSSSPIASPKGKYRIVYIITNCKKTGPMNQTLNIIKNLNRNVFEPIIVTLFEEDLGNSILPQYLNEVFEFYCLKLNRFTSILTGKKILASCLKNIKPHLIQGIGMPPYTLSLGYTNALHLVTLRNYCYQDYPDKYGKLLGKLLAFKDMRLISKQVKRGETFITCSKSLEEIYLKKHKMKFDVICNGVDISNYTYTYVSQKEKIKKSLGLPLDKTIIAYTGQFINRKNQQFAIQGFLSSKHSMDCVMVFMGDGPNLETIKQKYKDDLRFIFTGNIINVNEYLQASDIYISTSESEGMPNGVLEAMATGLPVLLSDIPQHLEILNINAMCGLSYKLGNIKDFVQKFDRIMKMNWAAMGKVSYEIITKELTSKKMSEKYQKLYLKLIENLQ